MRSSTAEVSSTFGSCYASSPRKALARIACGNFPSRSHAWTSYSTTCGEQGRKTVSSHKRKAAAIGSVVLLFARVLRLLNRENYPIVYVRELEDAANGIEAEALFETIH